MRKKRISLVYAESCYERPYLKINFADIWLVFAYTVTYYCNVHYVTCVQSVDDQYDLSCTFTTYVWMPSAFDSHVYARIESWSRSRPAHKVLGRYLGQSLLHQGMLHIIQAFTNNIANGLPVVFPIHLECHGF